MKKVAFGGRVEFARPLSLNQDLQEESEEIEVFLRRGQGERVDLEIVGFEAHADIRAAEQLREALKAPAQIEDEGVRSIFLKIGDEEIQKETFSRARPAENHGVGHVAVVEI